jgi:hypothetical protein
MSLSIVGAAQVPVRSFALCGLLARPSNTRSCAQSAVGGPNRSPFRDRERR